MPSDLPIKTGPLSDMPDRDAMNAILAQHWWTIVLRGVIAVLFGIIALAAPGAVLLSLALLFGIYLLADGVIGLVGTVRAVRTHGHWGALLAEAVLNILMGLVALFMPGRGGPGFRAADGGLGVDIRRPDAVGGATAACQPWTLVARARRRRVADLGRDAGGGAADRRRGADVVARNLRDHLRHRAAALRLAVARPTDGLTGLRLKLGRPFDAVDKLGLAIFAIS